MSVIQETRNTGEFKELENRGTADIVFIPSERFVITLSGRKEDIDRTYTDVHGDRLIVWQDSQNNGSLFGIFGKSNSSIGPVTVTVEAPTLREISVMGTGKFKCSGTQLTCDSMKLAIMGTSRMEIDGLDCRGNADFTISGVGDIIVSGTVEGHVNATLNGVGNISGTLSYSTIRKEKHGMGEISI